MEIKFVTALSLSLPLSLSIAFLSCSHREQWRGATRHGVIAFYDEANFGE